MKVDKKTIKVLGEGLAERTNPKDWDAALYQLRKTYKKMRIKITDEELKEIKDEANKAYTKRIEENRWGKLI